MFGMAAAVNLELDPIFLKALGFLHSKSKDSAEKLKTLLDESLARGIDSSYRPSQKDVEPPKISSTKTVSVKQEPKHHLVFLLAIIMARSSQLRR